MRPEREQKQRPSILAVDHDAVTGGLLVGGPRQRRRVVAGRGAG